VLTGPLLPVPQAGLAIGHSEGTAYEPLGHSAGALLIAAGADESLVPGWIEEGRGRRKP
jgi:hypothetical protein